MELTFSAELEAFRKVARDFLEQNLTGKFEPLKGRGGPGDEDYEIELRIEWGKVMGKAGWNCVGWPKQHGGRERPEDEPPERAASAPRSSGREAPHRASDRPARGRG